MYTALRLANLMFILIVIVGLAGSYGHLFNGHLLTTLGATGISLTFLVRLYADHKRRTASRSF